MRYNEEKVWSNVTLILLLERNMQTAILIYQSTLHKILLVCIKHAQLKFSDKSTVKVKHDMDG